MQFTDIIFSLFLFIVFSLYWLGLRRSKLWQNILLLAASYTFYGWWDKRFLLLIILTSLTTYLTASDSTRRYSKILTVANIVLNLGILVLFKYFNFFSDNLVRLFSIFGLGLDWFTVDVLLPVGISFYTFQAIGYSIDVYKGRARRCNNLIAFCTFIAYFPQLVAGPIERATQLLPQIAEPRKWNTGQAISGMRMIMFGLLKKLCVADMIALYVDKIYSGEEITPVMTLAGGILFSIEIYCDFSAYSEIARGVSRLLGIELMANFRFPYFSRNILEFWRRWHISLMHWFRDYLYIPLGGSRRGTAITIRNTVIVFLLSGLWHGAAWNFILWGAYWSVMYVASKFIFKQRNPQGESDLKDIPRMILTFGIVALGFYFFRCSTWSEVASGLTGIWIYVIAFGTLWLITSLLKRLNLLRVALYTLLITGVVAITCQIMPAWYLLLKVWWLVPAIIVLYVEWKSHNEEYPLQRISCNRMSRYCFYWICIFFIIISEPTEMTFIYFQF